MFINPLSHFRSLLFVFIFCSPTAARANMLCSPQRTTAKIIIWTTQLFWVRGHTPISSPQNPLLFAIVGNCLACYTTHLRQSYTCRHFTSRVRGNTTAAPYIPSYPGASQLSSLFCFYFLSTRFPFLTRIPALRVCKRTSFAHAKLRESTNEPLASHVAAYPTLANPFGFTHSSTLMTNS